MITLVMVGLAGFGIGRAMENSRMDQTTLTVKTTVNELEMYITERGVLTPLEDESESEAARRFVNDFNANFTSMSFNMSTLKNNGQSFTVQSLIKTDPWGSKYMLYYAWQKEMFVVASAGPNMMFDFLTGKDAGEVDDIFAAVLSK